MVLSRHNRGIVLVAMVTVWTRHKQDQARKISPWRMKEVTIFPRIAGSYWHLRVTGGDLAFFKNEAPEDTTEGQSIALQICA